MDGSHLSSSNISSSASSVAYFSTGDRYNLHNTSAMLRFPITQGYPRGSCVGEGGSLAGIGNVFQYGTLRLAISVTVAFLVIARA